jgi:CheY-like chemotaxis protein
MNGIVRQCAAMFGRTRKEIQIREHYEADLWTVEVDRRQMEQVLLNLFVNAWQAMPGGGELYLRTENVHIDEHHMPQYRVVPGRYIKITVTDTGVGMSEATRQRIFEPFFTTKKMGRGTGLGLASAYGIVKNHNGYIDVHSESGRGSTFAVYLPASEKAPSREDRPLTEAVTGSGTVLLVDDEEIVREVGGPMLEQLGYRVLTAGGAREAIEVFQREKERIDLVILDLIMPGIGGGETFDRLKEIDPNVRVLLASGYSIDGVAGEILKRGCRGFIQKPFTLDQLSEKIRDILQPAGTGRASAEAESTPTGG